MDTRNLLFTLCCFTSLILAVDSTTVLVRQTEDDQADEKKRSEKESCSKTAPRPHIVMIVADDLGWDDLSFHGSTQILTPNIDVLANNGVILNSYYVQPICTPSRASFLTGRYPIHLGLQHGVIFGNQPMGLPLEEPILPQYLKPLGYESHAIGKWHLGYFQEEYTPIKRGFKSFFGFLNGGGDYWDHTAHEEYWGFDLRRNMEVVKDCTGNYSTDLFTSEAEKIIDKHDVNKPLFMYIAHQAVHAANYERPLQAPKKLIKELEYIENPQRRIFGGMVTALDESVGRIYKALYKKGMMENTVIVFTTDNGGATAGLNQNVASNYPFRGGKDNFWEGGVRGISFVHSPLIKRPSRVSYDLIEATDWLPTFYNLAGGDLSKMKQSLDGFNVWDTISEGKDSPRKEVLHTINPYNGIAAMRVGQYKLVVNQDINYYGEWYPRYKGTYKQEELPNFKTLPGAEIQCGKKPSIDKCDPKLFPCLFDLHKDPCEYHNIALEQPVVVAKIFGRLLHLQSTARDVIFPDREAFAAPVHRDGVWGPWKTSNTEIALNRALKSVPTADVRGCFSAQNQPKKDKIKISMTSPKPTFLNRWLTVQYRDSQGETLDKTLQQELIKLHKQHKEYEKEHKNPEELEKDEDVNIESNRFSNITGEETKGFFRIRIDGTKVWEQIKQGIIKEEEDYESEDEQNIDLTNKRNIL